MAVYVLDKRKKPLDPCSEKRARKLLSSGRARIHRLVPFVIRLVDRTVGDSILQDHTVRIDPGSKVTGIALVRKADASGAGVCPTVIVRNLVELEHRGSIIRDRLASRSAFRRRRRSKLRFRPARFSNLVKPKGWLPPSLRHRIETVFSTVARLRRWLPVRSIEVELVRFDTQLMQDPEASGIAYQRGELAGYEAREYLLEKWDRQCAYCDARNLPLQIDHVVPRARGGSDRVSNLTLACAPCNTAKGASSVDCFLADDPMRLRKIKARLKAPLRDAAAMNATRWALFAALRSTGLVVSAGTGGRTKWNRSRLGIPKSHSLDAACVGITGSIEGWRIPTLLLRSTGRGSYCRTRFDRFGFPRGYLTRSKTSFGFATGDLVVADVPDGLKAGRHLGRVAVRSTGWFNITTAAGVVQGISHRRCRILQRGDGYAVSNAADSSRQPVKSRTLC